MLQWVEKIGVAAGWSGRVELLEGDALPEHLRAENDYSGDLVVDTTAIRAELGYAESLPADEAARRTVEWERAHPPAKIDAASFDYDAEDEALA